MIPYHIPYHIRLIMWLTYATYNNRPTVQQNIISPVELKFTIVTLLKKLKSGCCQHPQLAKTTTMTAPLDPLFLHRSLPAVRWIVCRHQCYEPQAELLFALPLMHVAATAT